MSLASNVITFKTGVKPEGAVVADIENGYCKIANELLESICQLDISGSQFQVLMAVIRCTYGYNKKSDRVTNTYLVQITGLSEKAVRDALNTLVERNLITCEKSGIMKIVAINKVVSEWSVKSDKAANMRKGTEQMHRSKCTNQMEQMHREDGANAPKEWSKCANTKDNLNTTNKRQPTKDNQSFPASIKFVFEHWKTAMGKPLAKLTEDRKSKIKARLEDGYSVETIIRAIDGCAASDFHMGRQAGSTAQYCDFDLICRNGSKLEQFAAMPLRAEPEDWTANIMKDAEVLF